MRQQITAYITTNNTQFTISVLSAFHVSLGYG